MSDKGVIEPVVVSVGGSELEDPVVVVMGSLSLMGVIWWILERIEGMAMRSAGHTPIPDVVTVIGGVKGGETCWGNGQLVHLQLPP